MNAAITGNRSSMRSLEDELRQLGSSFAETGNDYVAKKLFGVATDIATATKALGDTWIAELSGIVQANDKALRDTVLAAFGHSVASKVDFEYVASKQGA